MSRPSLIEIADTTRRFIAEGDIQAALSYSGEQLALLHSLWGNEVRAGRPAQSLLAEMLLALDNHARVLISQGLFTDAYTTSIVALAQAIGSTKHDDVNVVRAEMTVLSVATVALMQYVEATPPSDETASAHLSAMIVETASLLYHKYKAVMADDPQCPALPDIYSLLKQLLSMGAVTDGSVKIGDRDVPVSDQGAILGDLLGRALALGWLAD